MRVIKLPPELSDGTHSTIVGPEENVNIQDQAFLEQYDEGTYEIEIVEMTEEKYNNLPEL